MLTSKGIVSDFIMTSDKLSLRENMCHESIFFRIFTVLFFYIINPQKRLIKIVNTYIESRQLILLLLQS